MGANLAIIELGGKQHLVTPGAKVVVNRLDAVEGAILKLADLLSDQSVEVKVTSHMLGKKVDGLKFKPKTRYLKRYGHRQHQTTVEVISVGDKSMAEATKPAITAPTQPAVKKTAPKRRAVSKEVKNG